MSCPLSPARRRAFDHANALTADASRYLLAGNPYQAAKRYELAAQIPGLSDACRKQLLMVAVELLLELYATVRPVRVTH